LESERSPSGPSGKLGPFRIARRDEQRTAHLRQIGRRRVTRPVRHQRARRAVRDERDRLIRACDGIVERRHPVGTARRLPFRLLDTVAGRIALLPERLPMLGPRARESGENEGGGKRGRDGHVGCWLAVARCGLLVAGCCRW
jgi:hypothetical protein